jgi:FtsH-binding integral membrane protein
MTFARLDSRESFAIEDETGRTVVSLDGLEISTGHRTFTSPPEVRPIFELAGVHINDLFWKIGNFLVVEEIIEVGSVVTCLGDLQISSEPATPTLRKPSAIPFMLISGGPEEVLQRFRQTMSESFPPGILGFLIGVWGICRGQTPGLRSIFIIVSALLLGFVLERQSASVRRLYPVDAWASRSMLYGAVLGFIFTPIGSIFLSPLFNPYEFLLVVPGMFLIAIAGAGMGRFIYWDIREPVVAKDGFCWTRGRRVALLVSILISIIFGSDMAVRQAERAEIVKRWTGWTAHDVEIDGLELMDVGTPVSVKLLKDHPTKFQKVPGGYIVNLAL